MAIIKMAKLQNGDCYNMEKLQNGDCYKTTTVIKRRNHKTVTSTKRLILQNSNFLLNLIFCKVFPYCNSRHFVIWPF